MTITDPHRYMVVVTQIVGSPADWSRDHNSDLELFTDRQAAIDHGWALHDHDDFNIATIVDGRIVAYGFEHEDFPNPEEDFDAAEIERQLGLPDALLANQEGAMEATNERVRLAERLRVARYLERAAAAREGAGLPSGAYDAGVLREAAEWCREPSIWDDQESDPDLGDLEAAVGNARVRFWTCPVREHGDRNDERGWPVVTVEWRDGVARCTAPGCVHASEERP